MVRSNIFSALKYSCAQGKYQLNLLIHLLEAKEQKHKWTDILTLDWGTINEYWLQPQLRWQKEIGRKGDMDRWLITHTSMYLKVRYLKAFMFSFFHVYEGFLNWIFRLLFILIKWVLIVILILGCLLLRFYQFCLFGLVLLFITLVTASLLNCIFFGSIIFWVSNHFSYNVHHDILTS